MLLQGRSPWRSSWRSQQVCSWEVLGEFAETVGVLSDGNVAIRPNYLRWEVYKTQGNAMHLGRPEKFSIGTWRHPFGVIDTPCADVKGSAVVVLRTLSQNT